MSRRRCGRFGYVASEGRDNHLLILLSKASVAIQVGKDDIAGKFLTDGLRIIEALGDLFGENHLGCGHGIYAELVRTAKRYAPLVAEILGADAILELMTLLSGLRVPRFQQPELGACQEILSALRIEYHEELYHHAQGLAYNGHITAGDVLSLLETNNV